MKRYIISIIAVFYLSFTYGQQLITYSQFMHDHYLLNPAAAGSKDYIPVTLAYKKMWTGMNGSPSFQTLAGNSKIMDNMGVGAVVRNYTTGYENKFGLDLTYSYAINVGTDNKLAFGLTASLYQFYFDKDKITIENPDDNTINYANEQLIVPDANFGTYFYGKNYYAGIAVFQLFGRKVNMMNTDYLENRQERMYLLHGGYKFEINDDYTVEPSLLAKFVEAGEYHIELNVKGTFKNIAWAGISYRLNDAVVPMFGIEMEQFVFGYAYDITLSDLKTYSQGSHELIFIYKIGNTTGPASY